MTKMMIATPLGSRGAGAHSEYIQGLVRMVAALAKQGIEVDYRASCASPLSNARNELADEFLQSDCDAMLWLDDDNVVDASVVGRMLATGFEFVCAAYRRRVFDQLTLQNPRADFAFVCLLHEEWYQGGRLPVIERECARLAATGFGIVLLRRSALERVADVAPVYRSHLSRRLIRGYFTELLADGEFVSEDVSFCRRFRQAGGTLWCLIDAPTEHWNCAHCWAGNIAYALGDLLAARQSAMARSNPAPAIVP